MATAVDFGPAIDLSSVLRALLAREHLSQRELARTLCIDDSVINLWVAGKRLVPAYRVPEIATTFSMNESELRAAVPGRLAPRPATPKPVEPPPPSVADVLAAAQDLDRFWLAPEGNVPPAPKPEPMRTFIPTVTAPEQRLEEACLVPREHPNLVWEAFCFICGRGTGPGGVLAPTREAPRVVGHCRFCQGVMFVREIGYSPIAQLMYQPLTCSDERRVA